MLLAQEKLNYTRSDRELQEALGILNFLTESCLLGKVTTTIHTDSSSAKSIATRIGVSKLTKHIQLRYLYVQDLVATNIIRIRKVSTHMNYADPLTKILPQQALLHHLPHLGLMSTHYDIGDEYTRPLHLQHVQRRTKSFQVCSISLLPAAVSARTTTCSNFVADYLAMANSKPSRVLPQTG